MSTFPAFKIPEPWKPLLKALADTGWELREGLADGLAADCRLVLGFENDGLRCYLSFWEEAEWCGNHLQRHGLTVAGLSAEVPAERDVVEAHSLLLTGNWVEEVDEFIGSYFHVGGPYRGVSRLTTNGEQW